MCLTKLCFYLIRPGNGENVQNILDPKLEENFLFALFKTLSCFLGDVEPKLQNSNHKSFTMTCGNFQL